MFHLKKMLISKQKNCSLFNHGRWCNPLKRHFKDVFGYILFYWNWKIITESTVDKGKS